RHSALFWTVIIWLTLHMIVICLNPNFWGGSSYGNRLFADAVPGLIIWSLMVWRCILKLRSSHWREVATSLLTVFTIFTVFVHTSQGLYNPYTADWIQNIDADDNRRLIFDGKHPQFLASPELLKNRDYEQAQPLPTP